MPDDCFTIEWGKCYSRDECRAVGITRYGAGVLDWTKEELKSIDLKARKLITMNGSLHPRGNVGILQERKEEEGL